QNGLGIEEPFLRGSFDQIHRGVLYVANQSTAEHDVSFRALASSAIGLVRVTAAGLAECVSLISTPRFPFHPEPDIRRDVWRKVIDNCVFNSICPVLDIDNGVFARDADVAALAREIIRECVAVARAQGAPITEAEVIDRKRVGEGERGGAR